jgi:hypothetical protein
MNNKPYNQKQNKMKTRTTKPFDISRVREFCKLVNEGHTPTEAIYKMNSSRGYCRPLFEAGFYWKENGTYRAVERIHTDRYLLFTEKKDQYNELKKLGKTKLPKQTNLFSQPKSKQTTTNAPTMKPKERQLNFIQRVVKSLFNL